MFNTPSSEEDREDFATAYVKYRSNADKWGIKNPPLLAFQAQYLLPHLDQVKFVITKRKREDQKRSIFAAINRLDDDTLNKRLENTYSKIEEIVKDHEYFTVNFDDWFTDKAEQQMKGLAEFCEFQYEEGMVERYVEKRLHRFK